MFKRTDAPGQEEAEKKPLVRNYIRELWEQHKVKEVLEALKPLNLKKEDLVIIKEGKALVIPERTFKQIEQLGRIGLSIKKGEVYELDIFANGRIVDDDIAVVDKFILPSEDRILAIKRGYNMRIRELNMDMVIFLKDAVEGVVGPSPRLWLTYQWLLNQALVRDDITYEKMFGTPWEIVAAENTSLHTKEYFKKFDVSSGVFCIHIHPENGPHTTLPTNYDVIHFAKSDKIPWFGILHVREGTPPEGFEFNREELSIYYSPAGDSKWVKKGKHDFDLSKGPEEFKKFEEHQKAVVKTYGELLELNGKHKQD